MEIAESSLGPPQPRLSWVSSGTAGQADCAHLGFCSLRAAAEYAEYPISAQLAIVRHQAPPRTGLPAPIADQPQQPSLTVQPDAACASRLILAGCCLLLLPLHAWAAAVLASVSALAVMPPGRPEDATTATAVPA